MPDIIKADGNGAMLYFTASEMREVSESLWRIADNFPYDAGHNEERKGNPDGDQKYARRLANFFNEASQEVAKVAVAE